MIPRAEIWSAIVELGTVESSRPGYGCFVGTIGVRTKRPSSVYMPSSPQLRLLHVPSSASPRPPQGRTSWPSACGEVLNARSCQTSLSCVRPWGLLASPTW